MEAAWSTRDNPKRGFCLKLIAEVHPLKACHLYEQRRNCFLTAVVGKWKHWRWCFTHKSPLMYLFSFYPLTCLFNHFTSFLQRITAVSHTCSDLPAPWCQVPLWQEVTYHSSSILAVLNHMVLSWGCGLIGEWGLGQSVRQVAIWMREAHYLKDESRIPITQLPQCSDKSIIFILY